MTKAPRIPGKPGTLQSILRGAGLSTEEFRKLL